MEFMRDINTSPSEQLITNNKSNSMAIPMMVTTVTPQTSTRIQFGQTYGLDQRRNTPNELGTGNWKLAASTSASSIPQLQGSACGLVIFPA